MVVLRLTLLGGFEARLASDSAFRLSSKKSQALLAYLCLPAGQTHRRDKLAALLWGERSEKHARDGLRHALLTLRKAIPRGTPPSLIVSGQTLAVNPAAVDVDAMTFERLARDGAPEALQEAAAIYRGDLLLGFGIEEPLFEDWLIAERERLREVAIEALARLLAHQTKSPGGTERAIQTAVRLLGIDPLQEPVHRSLMRLYARQGRRGAALKQYRVCMEVLQRELRAEPEAETHQLYQEILRTQNPPLPAAESVVERPAPPLAATAAVAPIRWDRRHLTVLGARLALAETTASRALAAVLRHWATTLSSFGARLEEITPSGVLAVFGIDPIEDGPRRAVHAACAMLRVLQPTSDRGFNGLEGRCAIHVGQYLIASAGPITGMDAHARHEARIAVDALLEQTGANSVVLDEAAARFVKPQFELQSTDHAALPGYVLISGERVGLDVSGSTLTPLVGREQDLITLRELLRRAEQGAAQGVGLVGEPGVGKSRLVYEFLRTLEPGRVSFLEGRCRSYASAMPYLPIIELVRRYAGIIDSDAPSAIVQKMNARLEDLDLDPAHAVSYLLHLLGVGEGTEQLQLSSPSAVKYRTLEILKHVVHAASGRRPLLIIIEDLHWGDPTSEEVLAALLESLAACPLMLLTTYRPGYRPPWLTHSCASQLVVTRLRSGDSSILVRSVRPDLPPDLADAIVGRGDGVPFFLEELARAVPDGVDVRHGVRVADTIESVLLARLDQLTGEDRQVLETASVIGKDVALPVLEAVVDTASDLLHESLRRLQQAEFMYQASAFPTAVYTFRHALTQDVTYWSLAEEQRRAHHARIAATIETLAPETRERQPEVLAQHYTLAANHQPAIDNWHRAAQRALERAAYAEALTHVKVGLELVESSRETPRGRQQELNLQMALGTALLRTKGFTVPEVERAFTRARELCRSIHDSPELFPVLFGLWAMYISRGELDTAEELAAQLSELAVARSDPILLAGAHTTIGQLLLFRGRLAEARERLERAAALHTPESSVSFTAIYGHDIGSSILALYALTLATQGEHGQAMEVADRALAQARHTGHPFSLAFALHLVALASLISRDAPRAGLVGEEEVSVSREHGFPLFEAGGLWFTAYALAMQGARDRGLDLMGESERAYEIAGAWGVADFPRQCATGELLMEAGCNQEAMDVIQQALARSEQRGGRWFHAELLRLYGEGLLRQDVRDECQAEQRFLEAIDMARHQGARPFALRAAISLARLWAQQGKRSAAREQLENVYRWFPEGVEGMDQRTARRLLRSWEGAGGQYRG